MELLRFLRVLRRRWRLLLTCALVLGVGGYLSAAMEGDDQLVDIVVVRYSARHTLILDTKVEAAQRLPGSDNLLSLAQRVALGDTPKAVATTLKRDPADVARRVRVTVRADAQTMTISTFDETADGAAKLADTYAAAFTTYLKDEAANVHQDRVAKAQLALDEAEARLRKVRSDLAVARSGNDAERVRQLEQDESLYVGLRIRANSDLLAVRTAGVPTVPVESLEPAKATEISTEQYERALLEGASGLNVKQLTPNDKDDDSPGSSGFSSPLPGNPLARAALGGAAGLVLGALAALTIEKLDPRIRTKEDVEELLDLPVIAEIPSLSRRERKQTNLTARLEPLSHTAESFRRMRSAIDFASLTRRGTQDKSTAAQPSLDGLRNGEVILVTSPGPSEGKTTSTANLASVIAEHDRQVLVINCDYRRPRVQHYLRASDAPQQVHDTEVPGVHLITHVLADELAVSPAEVVAAQRKVIERARHRFDTVLLDTAPLLTTNDAADVLSVVDMVVLIVHAGRTTREAAERAAELLARRRAPLIGIVLVGARDMANSYYYYEGDEGYLRRAKRSGKQSEARADRGRAKRKDRKANDSKKAKGKGKDGGAEREAASEPREKDGVAVNLTASGSSSADWVDAPSSGSSDPAPALSKLPSFDTRPFDTESAAAER